MNRPTPRLFELTEGIEDVAPAGSILWFDPTSHPSVRVVSFPSHLRDTIPDLIATGTLTPCQDVLAPQLSNWTVESPRRCPPRARAHALRILK